MRIGILGGSFNPVHVGHVRLALEVLEASLPGAGERLHHVDMLPCAQPPHKPPRGLLPFALRLQLLRAAVAGIPGLEVNDLEGERPGPSYTCDTLAAYRKHYPDARLLFILGGEDFACLPQWRRGLELPQLADLAVVPRAGSDQADFQQDVLRNWPEARLIRTHSQLYAELPGDKRLIYLPLPRLDISASHIRQRWLAGRNVRFLLPDAVLHMLEEQRPAVAACWHDSPA